MPRRRPAAAKKPGRGRGARAAPVEEEKEADDEPQPLVNGGGKGGRKGRAPRGKKRSSDEALEDGDMEEPEPGRSNSVEKRHKVNGKVGRVKFRGGGAFELKRWEDRVDDGKRVALTYE